MQRLVTWCHSLHPGTATGHTEVDPMRDDILLSHPIVSGAGPARERMPAPPEATRPDTARRPRARRSVAGEPSAEAHAGHPFGVFDCTKVSNDMEPSPLRDVTTVNDVLLRGELFESRLPRPPHHRPSSLLVFAGIPFAGGPS